MIRRNAILALVLVAQLIVSVLVFVLPGRATTAEAAPLLASFKPAEVSQITLRDKDGQQLQLARKDSGWVLPQRDDFPVEPAKVTAFLDKLATIQTGRLIATTPASQLRLQVADNNFSRRVDLTAGGAPSQTLFIGSPASNTTHVRAGGSDNVYLTDKLNPYDANLEPSNWINTSYYTLTQDNLARVTVTNISGTLTFERTPMNTWKLDQLSPGQTLDEGKLMALLGRLSNVSMTEPLGKTPAPEYGLDKPTATVTFTMKGDALNAAPVVLTIGAKDAAKSAVTIKASTSPYIVRISDFTVEDLPTLTAQSFVKAAAAAPKATPASP